MAELELEEGIKARTREIKLFNIMMLPDYI